MSLKIVAVTSIALASTLWLSYGAKRVLTQGETVLAPCKDAVGAFLAQNPRCYALDYSKRDGLHAKCAFGDVQFTDAIVGANHLYTSLLWTELRTMKQGFCDCERPYGPACEQLP
jgi:hypothetical protein